MTDREMIELAAKAAGMTIDTHYVDGGASAWAGERHNSDWIPNWNPLTDDGDALRLAVKLGLEVCVEPDIGVVTAGIPNKGWQEKHIDDGEDLCAATRLVIFSTAAMIGWAMKEAALRREETK